MKKMTAQRVLVIGLWVALFAMAARETVDPDMWWHLATGRTIAQTRSIPRQDVFSYTASDHTWITHEWLTQVGMIGLYDLGGLTALLLATCAVVTLSFFIVYMQCDARPHLAVFAVLVGALASAVTWGPRPQMLNILLTALLLHVLRLLRVEKRPLWWAIPALTAVWVNLHSGYLLSYVIAGAVLAGDGLAHLLDARTPDTLDRRGLRNLALALGASLIAALLNPNGWKMLWYPFETLGSKAMQEYIQEWAPPAFNRPEYWPLIALLFGGVLVLTFTRRRRDLADLALFFGFGFMSLLSARHIPLFAVAAAPIFTRYAAQIELGRLRWDLSAPPPARPPRGALLALNWLLVLVFVAAGTLYVADVLVKNRTAEARHFPVRAVEFIEQNGLAGRKMYNSYNWGGYLLWRGYKVFIDGRADVYLDDFMNEYVLAYHLAGDWRVPLDRFDVEYVLIERGASLATLLDETDEWVQTYADDQAVIYVRASE